MRQLKVFVALLGFAAAAASAQPPGPHGGPHGMGFGGPLDIDKLAILLDLDAYQKGEVQRVLTEQREAMRTERKQQQASGERPSFDEMRARRQQNEEALVGKLKNVLTDSQITKLKVLMEPSRGPRGPRGGQPADSPPDGPGAN